MARNVKTTYNWQIICFNFVFNSLYFFYIVSTGHTCTRPQIQITNTYTLINKAYYIWLNVQCDWCSTIFVRKINKSNNLLLLFALYIYLLTFWRLFLYQFFLQILRNPCVLRHFFKSQIVWNIKNIICANEITKKRKIKMEWTWHRRKNCTKV